IAIRRRLEELTGQKVPDRAQLADLSQQLFQVYDARRRDALDKELAAGLALARQGQLAAAGQRLDAILVQAPDYGRQGEMAETYFQLGEQLAAAGKWREAASAFGKASSVAPDGPLGGAAL